MARTVKIFVVDGEGYGQLGQRVKLYGGSEKKTDKNGATSLLIESPEVTIYVNGFQAFSGSTSRLGSEETFTKSGGRP